MATRKKTAAKPVKNAVQPGVQAGTPVPFSKQELLLNLSHEIRPPMNGVIGMAQLLRTTALDNTQLEYLDCLEVSAKSLFYLMNDIFELALEPVPLQPELADFSLRGIINNIVKTQHADLHFKGLGLQLDIPAALPDIFRGDQLRAKLVLLNLLGNAIKYTEQGSVLISVAVVEHHDDQMLLQISIRDSGIGMDEATLAGLFATETVLPQQGTERKLGVRGLGITTCRKLVDLMGGRIWAESSLGSGSTFHLILPFTVMRQSASSALQESTDPLAAQWRGPTLNILLAEDNLINQKYAATVLQGMGHRVVCCTNGKEAVKQAQQHQFDLILMDIQMPVMDGIEALAAIRCLDSETGRHTPVIALTAHAQAEEKKLLLETGFDGYVPKPVELEVLIKEIRAACPTARL